MATAEEVVSDLSPECVQLLAALRAEQADDDTIETLLAEAELPCGCKGTLIAHGVVKNRSTCGFNFRIRTFGREVMDACVASLSPYALEQAFDRLKKVREAHDAHMNQIRFGHTSATAA